MHLSAELVERKNELLLALRREMNGAVAGSMRDGGINYGLNFGVSVPTIRSVAARYAGDDELASEVWKSSVRELRLAGLFIATPQRLVGDAWSGAVDTMEIAENYIWSLSRSEEALREVVGRLSRSLLPFNRYMILLAYARRPHLFPREEVERACVSAEQSGVAALQRAAENLRICLE